MGTVCGCADVGKRGSRGAVRATISSSSTLDNVYRTTLRLVMIHVHLRLMSSRGSAVVIPDSETA
jgi:hypothetical protein